MRNDPPISGTLMHGDWARAKGGGLRVSPGPYLSIYQTWPFPSFLRLLYFLVRPNPISILLQLAPLRRLSLRNCRRGCRGRKVEERKETFDFINPCFTRTRTVSRSRLAGRSPLVPRRWSVPLELSGGGSRGIDQYGRLPATSSNKDRSRRL